MITGIRSKPVLNKDRALLAPGLLIKRSLGVGRVAKTQHCLH